MDDRSFDRLARILGGASDRRTGLKALVGGILGAGALAALDDAADAKRRGRGRGDDRRRGDDAEAEKKKKKKKTCKPACGSGYECVKTGRKRECVCASGVTCGQACCAAGQSCENGVCANAPDPVACIAAGEPCKNVGRSCCDGRVCSSGQGGESDIACYAPKTGRCERTTDCVYGMACQGGRCAPPPPAEGLGVACDAAAQQLCATSGATCTAYTGAGAPAGAYCTLGLRKVCTGDPQCTCYKCWYTAATISGQGRNRQGSTNTMACCHPQGQSCAVDQDCCLGLSCVNGTCGGTICTPDDTAGCSASVPCCNPAATCVNGTCTTCGPSTCPNGCCKNGQCQTGTADSACGRGGAACATCGGSTPACGANRVCVLCTTANTTACTDSSKPNCSAGGTCVQCAQKSHCTNSQAPYCGYNDTCVGTCPIEYAKISTADTEVASPIGVAVNDGKVYVTNYSVGSVSVYDKQTSTWLTTGTTGTGQGWSGQWLQGMTTTADGKVLVAGYTAGSFPPQVWEVKTSTGEFGYKGAEYAPRWDNISQFQPYGLFSETKSDGTVGTLWMTGVAFGDNFDVIASFDPAATGADRKTVMRAVNVCGAIGVSPEAMEQGATAPAKFAREIVRDPATGLLWVACEQADKIMAFDPTGWAPITGRPTIGGSFVPPQWQQLTTPAASFSQNKPFGLSLVGSTLYVSSREANGKLYRYEVGGTAQAPTLTTTCIYDTSTLGSPTGIQWDSAAERLWINSFTTTDPAVTNNTTAARVT